MFSATDLVSIGNKWRADNGLSQFNLSLFMKSKGFLEFKSELEGRYGNVVTIGRGRGSETWVHPLILIDIALAISPKLKVEAYEWMYDNLLLFRNDSVKLLCRVMTDPRQIVRVAIEEAMPDNKRQQTDKVCN